MTSEQHKAVLHRWMDTFNTNDHALLDRLAGELYTPDYILHDPGLPALAPGPAGIRQFVEIVYTNWSKVKLSIDELVAEGDKVALAFTLIGVSNETGKETVLQGLSMSRFVNGKIAEEWSVHDKLMRLQRSRLVALESAKARSPARASSWPKKGLRRSSQRGPNTKRRNLVGRSQSRAWASNKPVSGPSL